MAKYFNTKTGQETNIFSEVDWKSGQPQRAGWIDTESAPVKSKPKEIVDFVFKKPNERITDTEKPPANVDKVIAETVKDIATAEVQKFAKKAITDFNKQKDAGTLEIKPVKKTLTPKKTKNDNPGKRRTPGKRNT
jgi:hypothetical protein